LFAYPVLVGVICMEAFRQMRRDEQAGVPMLVFVALLFSSFGLLPLIKGSLLILCALVWLLTLWTMVLRADWRLMLTTLMAPVLTMLFYWWWAGQALHDLPGYFNSMLPIISGYTDAMSREGFLHEIVLYVMSALLLLWFVWKREGSIFSSLFLMLGGALFLAFKAGYVRHDAHAVAAPVFLMLLASVVCLFPINQQRSAWAVRTAYVIGFLLFLSSVLVYGIDPGKLKEKIEQRAVERHEPVPQFNHLPRADQVRLIRHALKPADVIDIVMQGMYFPLPYPGLWQGASARILHPGTLQKQFQLQTALIKQSQPLPALDGTVDIYSFNQSALIASGNKWHPRPVFQSYSVYTPTLVEKNHAHLLGTNAPDHVLFSVEPIDQRVPSSEEGINWQLLLHRYAPVSFEGKFLHLKKNAGLFVAVEPTLLVQGKARLGQAFSVPQADGPVYAEMDFKPSVLGRVFNLFYKSNQLTLTAMLADGTSHTFRLVPGMVKTGFMVSPLVENTAEFALLFSPLKRLSHKRVVSLTVNKAGRLNHWSDEFTVVFKADNAHLSRQNAYAKNP
jgi:hypothetical protein